MCSNLPAKLDSCTTLFPNKKTGLTIQQNTRNLHQFVHLSTIYLSITIRIVDGYEYRMITRDKFQRHDKTCAYLTKLEAKRQNTAINRVTLATDFPSSLYRFLGGTRFDMSQHCAMNLHILLIENYQILFGD